MLIGVNVHNMILTNLTFPAPQSLSFYGMLPEEFTESHATNFEQIEIKGRSSPLASYGGSSARSTEISVLIHEDYLAEFNGGKADITEYIAQIKALTYPLYKGTLTIPPKVLLRVGDFFSIRGYCANCSITWKLPIRDRHYIQAQASFAISESLPVSYTAEDIFSGADIRRA